MFGDSLHGHPIAGTTDSLTHHRQAHITKLHARIYRPDNAILVIGGDITAKDGVELVRKRYFGDWQKPTTPLLTISASMAETASKAGRA